MPAALFVANVLVAAAVEMLISVVKLKTKPNGERYFYKITRYLNFTVGLF